MSSPDPTRPTSVRIGIARLAGQVIVDDPDVEPADGSRRSTADGDDVIPGVVAAAGVDGRIDVDLHLVAYLPPRPLGEQAASVRAGLVAAARRSGLAARLGEIDVTIHDLVERGPHGEVA
jgi:hypothetical protein